MSSLRRAPHRCRPTPKAATRRPSRARRWSFDKDSVLHRVHYLLALLLATAGLAAAEVGPSLLDLNKAAFFYGREYFILRSGRAQMLLQADRADLGPAFTWMLFDAQDAKQSARKERAFNFVAGEGFGSSALEVVLGGFPFTALGHRTDTRWVSGGWHPHGRGGLVGGRGAGDGAH